MLSLQHACPAAFFLFCLLRMLSGLSKQSPHNAVQSWLAVGHGWCVTVADPQQLVASHTSATIVTREAIACDGLFCSAQERDTLSVL